MNSFTLAYSSCPNDTFIFHALTHRLIQSHGFDFKITMADVETLNQHATNKFFDITKLSFATFGAIRDNYSLLKTGAALGRGCGPLVVSLPGKIMKNNIKVAVPGTGTTASVLFSMFIKNSFPEIKLVIVPMPFENIMPAVGSGITDFGVIIHEGRFIYQNMGLECLVDLGAWWETNTSLPIPLGCIAIKRDIYHEAEDIAFMIQNLIGQSIQYAFDNPYASRDYIKKHAQELDDHVIEQHINLYVNDFSKDIGEEGEAAIRMFFQKAEDEGIIKPSNKPLFAC
ncbi:MAG: 1,4-dihydroxy-6-naphthoate synthase [Desulfamplus sp.]|nr:1,4-dihydroxy-6-naphthoate synthase [Desulfamplus sp.]